MALSRELAVDLSLDRLRNNDDDDNNNNNEY